MVIILQPFLDDKRTVFMSHKKTLTKNMMCDIKAETDTDTDTMVTASLPAKCSNSVWINRNQLFKAMLPYFFGDKTGGFSFQNNPKNLDPSSNIDLDLQACLGRVKLVL